MFRYKLLPYTHSNCVHFTRNVLSKASNKLIHKRGLNKSASFTHSTAVNRNYYFLSLWFHSSFRHEFYNIYNLEYPATDYLKKKTIKLLSLWLFHFSCLFVYLQFWLRLTHRHSTLNFRVNPLKIVYFYTIPIQLFLCYFLRIPKNNTRRKKV